MEHPFFGVTSRMTAIRLKRLGFAIDGFNGFFEFKRRLDAMNALQGSLFQRGLQQDPNNAGQRSNGLTYSPPNGYGGGADYGR